MSKQSFFVLCIVARFLPVYTAVITCKVWSTICESRITHTKAWLLPSCRCVSHVECKFQLLFLLLAGQGAYVLVTGCFCCLQAISDDNFHIGFNKIYDKNLARSLRNIFKKHAHLFKGLEDKYDLDLAASCTSIRDFDDAITRRTFGEFTHQCYLAHGIAPDTARAAVGAGT